MPDLAVWDLTGTHTEGDITLTYGSYGTEEMKNDGVKNPLIIWLHGAGEGGTDPSVAILGNQVTNLAKDVVQKYFITDTVKGAYVLTPQTPTMWMDGGDGQYSNEVGSQYYVSALKGLIDAYIEENGDIDMSRIYVGGCSNGGFMTVNMIFNFPDFFAAAYPVCEAYPTGGRLRRKGRGDQRSAHLVYPFRQRQHRQHLQQGRRQLDCPRDPHDSAGCLHQQPLHPPHQRGRGECALLPV